MDPDAGRDGFAPRLAAPVPEHAAAVPPDVRPPRQQALSVVLVAVALISAGIVTLGAPLIATIQAYYGVSGESAQWSYTVTLLVGATCTPVLGRLADGRARRITTVVVCLMVAVGCLLSALAGAFPVFLVGRALQGLGVALVAVSIAAARDNIGGPRGVRLIALLSVTTALGAGVSYPITTLVVERFGLPVAFLGAAGLCLLVCVAVFVGMPDMVDDLRPRGLDLPGALLLTAGTGLLLLAIGLGNSWGWTERRLLAITGGGAVLLALWVVVELRTRFPLVRLGLMAQPNVLLANVTAVLMGVSLYSTPALVTRIAQSPPGTGGAGLSLDLVGVILIPVTFGNLIGSRLAGRLTATSGPRRALALGGFVAALGPLAVLLPGSSVWRLLVAIALSAFGAGATFGSMPALILASVAPAETGSATSFNILLRAVGGALGSAGTAALLGAHPGRLPGQLGATGVALACLLCAVACIGAVIASAVIPASGAPRQV